MAAQMGPRRFQGRIKSYNAEKGYGFVESVEVYLYYRRDVFLHKARIGDFKVGDYVTFTVESNKDGMPQARNLAAVDFVAPAGKAKSAKPKAKGEAKKEKEKMKKDKV